MEKLPAEVLTVIAIHMQKRCIDEWAWDGQWTAQNETWKSDVSNLRLVNAHCASSVSHILFQDIKVSLYVELVAGSNRLKNLVRLSRSELAGYVKTLDITLHNTNLFSALGTREYEDTRKRTERFFRDLVQSLPLCLQAFHNLRSLDMICRRSEWTDELVPHKHCHQVDTMIAAILTHTPLDYLRNLTLRVPCTYNFHTIMNNNRDRTHSQCRPPLAEILSSLRSLSLHVCDISGPQGQRYLNRPPSALLRIFGSQEQYAQSLFDFAGMATDLESLAISCTAPLNFDLLATNRLFNLKNLSLSCVRTTGEHLLGLLAQNESFLDSICFTQVELSSRTWEDVFIQFCVFPHLLQVSIHSCGYAADGVSSRFRQKMLPLLQYPQSLESRRARDVNALKDITRLINQRRCERDLSEITLLLPSTDDG